MSILTNFEIFFNNEIIVIVYWFRSKIVLLYKNRDIPTVRKLYKDYLLKVIAYDHLQILDVWFIGYNIRMFMTATLLFCNQPLAASSCTFWNLFIYKKKKINKFVLVGNRKEKPDFLR